jgi:peptidoglycan/xylan/chitin deacetylase (PgdA/CDA1 family)
MRRRPGKKELLARWIHRTGIHRLLGHLPQRNSLLVINYHRVGDADATPYDPAVFSADADEFRSQVEYVALNLAPLTLDESLAYMQEPGRPHPTGRCRVLLTFDDGYRDNFDLAFPILRQAGVQATFFLPTSFVGTGQIPWWDEIAFIVKSARRRAFQLSYPRAASFNLDAEGLRNVLREVLNLYKSPEMLDAARFVDELESSCEGRRPAATQAERCFMTWEEAARMARGGMALGAHTHTHRLLGRLSEAEQTEELTTPRRILRERTGVEADTIAYPVGSMTSFTAETKALAAKTGYRAGFSFYGGINGGSLDKFDVRRVGADAQSVERFRVQTAAAALVGSWWP